MISRMLELEQSTVMHIHGNGLKKNKSLIQVCNCLIIYVVCSLHTGILRAWLYFIQCIGMGKNTPIIGCARMV